MYKRILTLGTMAAAMLLASPAHSYQETATIRMGQQEFRGQNNAISLKRLLRSAGYSAINKDIISVTVKAVSKVGRRSGQYGSIALKVGHNTSYAYTVYGGQHAYQSPLPRDLQQVTMYAPYSRHNQSSSNWQLIVDGPMKIGKVTVVMQTNRRHQRRCSVDRRGRTICDGVIVRDGRRDRPRARDCRVNRRGQRVCTDNRNDRRRDGSIGRGGDRRDDRAGGNRGGGRDDRAGRGGNRGGNGDRDRDGRRRRN